MKKIIFVGLVILLLASCDYFKSPESWDLETFQITPASGDITPGEPTKDCSYSVEPNVATSIKYCNEGGCLATSPVPPDCCSGYLSSLYGFLQDPGRQFVRVKQNAAIQCTKMLHSGSHRDGLGGEMIRVGSSVLDNAMVFIARGHCYWGAGIYQRTATNESYCVDPLTLQTIFVLKVRGAGTNGTTCPPDSASAEYKEANNYWWYFDVYVDKQAFTDPSNPTAAGLPDWIKNCQGWPDGRVPDTLGASTENQVLAAQTFNPPPIVASYLEINPVPAKRDDLKEYYLFNKELDSLPENWGELLGKYRDTQVNVWLSSDGRGILVLGTGQPGDKYYQYMILAEYTTSLAKTLQLASFLPTVAPVSGGHVYYEWWTPACKPALYFYPEKPTDLTVKVLPQGKITQTIPRYQNGWQVRAYPDGRVREIGGGDYPYLYYEAALEKVKVPAEQFLVEGKDLPEFFGQVLPILDLNQKETADFLDYWLKKLTSDKKWSIGLLPKDEVDRTEKIEFSSNPDNFLRIRFYFKPFEGTNKDLTAEKIFYSKGMNLGYFLNDLGVWSYRQKLTRNGFTVVDWGGILANGTCGINEISQ